MSPAPRHSRWSSVPGRSLALAAGLAATVASPASDTHLLVVTGIGGEPVYETQFHRWSATIVDAARDRLGLPAANVTWLSETPERDPARIAAPSTKAALLDAIESIAARSAPDDAVMILLVGHGTARDGRALFNLPGPDVSATELAAALDRLGDRPVAVVDTSASSGPFVAALSAPGRVIVTATANAQESDLTRYAAHFVAAYAEAGADADKDGRVSLLEAFEYARHEVRRAYELENEIVSEHALLDDDGDGEGTLEPRPDEGGDGALAKRFFLARSGLDPGADDPLRAALVAETVALVERVEALRRRRVGLDAEAYDAALESLLVSIALKRRALRAGAGP